MFIAVDGVDGAGKTTLVWQLAGILGEELAVVTKEPTNDPPWGQRLRASAVLGRLPREQELEYFHKDRLHHIQTVIQPSLDAEKIVISDRYVDSTLAFQAGSTSEAEDLYRRFKGEILIPDVTFILDCPVEIALGRISRDRQAFSAFERMDVLQRARQIYQSRRGSNYEQIAAQGTPADTLRQVLDRLKDRLADLRSACAAADIALTRLQAGESGLAD
jgi:dTMP kinase